MIWGLMAGAALLMLGAALGARHAVKRERARCERVVRVLAGQLRDGRITFFSWAAMQCIADPAQPVRVDLARPQKAPTSGMAAPVPTTACGVEQGEHVYGTGLVDR
jgi:hypothetical protein